ncbi:hypothetical protein RRG08_054113, partial [Elysia crispata]
MKNTADGVLTELMRSLLRLESANGQTSGRWRFDRYTGNQDMQAGRDFVLSPGPLTDQCDILPERTLFDFLLGRIFSQNKRSKCGATRPDFREFNAVYLRLWQCEI